MIVKRLSCVTSFGPLRPQIHTPRTFLRKRDLLAPKNAYGAIWGQSLQKNENIAQLMFPPTGVPLNGKQGPPAASRAY